MFEFPLYLMAALAGGLIPLILHLLKRRRSLPQPFPTLRFLLAAQKSSSRRIRIEHLLLWFLRTLIMVLLGVAFAMPVLRSTGSGLLGRAPRDVAIVLDLSYSMRYQTGRDTAFEQAVETAVELIQGLGENDRFCLFLADTAPRALIAEPIRDRETGIAHLRALRPGYGTSRLLPAIGMARDALQQAAGRRERELHVLTDNQALAWTSSDVEASPETDLPLTVFVTFSGVPAPENITPRSIDLRPAVLSKDSGAGLAVEVGHTGPPRETTVTLFINNLEIGRRVLAVGATQQTPVRLSIPPLPPGIHAGRVETPADNLPVDDAFHFLLRVRETRPTLVCGSGEDTFFLRAALRASDGGEASFVTVAPEALAEAPLEDYATVFLCNAIPLAGQAMTALEQFVRRGGLLVVFPGSRASVDDYRAWQCLPALPRDLQEFPRTRTRQTMTWSDPAHPVLQGLDGALTTPVLAVQRALQWDPLPEGTVPLVLLGAENPMLLERPFGEGRVLLFAVSADRSWSNFPLTPFYLPFVAQLVEYGAGLGSAPPQVKGSGLLPLARVMPDARPGLGLVGPDGKTRPVRSVLQDGQTMLYLEEATQPGTYRRSDLGDAVPALAVNLPREESDLTPVDPGLPAALLNRDRVHVATDRESLAERIREHRVGRSYGELLLWVVLGLLAAEFFLANRMARGCAPLSERFTLEPSGRIRGHAHPEP